MQKRVTLGLLCVLCLFPALQGFAQVNACDLNKDGTVNILDVMLAVKMANGEVPCTANIIGPGICDIVVVYRVIDAALAGVCRSVPVIHSVSLSWGPSPSVGILGYNIYRGDNPDGPFTRIAVVVSVVLSFTDYAVSAGQIHYYAVTAVDGSGVESLFSNVASATIPSP